MSVAADNEYLEEQIAQNKRLTSSTGGQKEAKDETYDDMYFPAFRERARVYAMGAKKYSRGNYRKGYPMSLSFSAMMRHIVAWQSGEDLDPESGLSHLAHAGWHVDNLMHLLWEHPEFDDRILSDRQREQNMVREVSRSIVSDPNYVHGPGDKCFDPKQSIISDPVHRRPPPIREGIVEERYFGEDGRPYGR